jgi:Tfp pilus assembly PilM family ATPase/Tfp pilus assembly protein PilN
MALTKCSLGLHLDGSRLRLLYLRKAWRDTQVVDTLALALPSAEEGEAPFSQEVQKFLLRNGVRSQDRVVLGIPRAEVLFRHFTTPPVQEKDLGDLVGFESERHLPGSKEEFTFGYTSLGRSGDGGRRVMLAAVKKKVLEDYLTVLRGANLSPSSVQPETAGYAAAFRSRHALPEHALLVSLGPASASVDLLEGGQVTVSRFFPLPPGGEEDTRTEAEALAAKLGDPFFRERLPDGKLPPLWLQGRGAENHSFCSLLEGKLGVPVHAFSPLPETAAGKAGGSAFGPAFGLALLGLQREGGGPELAGEAGEEPEEGPRYRTTASLGAILALAVLGIFGIRALQYHRQISRIDEAVAVMKDEKAAVERMNRAVRSKRSRLEFILANLGEVRQADLLREMTVLIPDDTYLTDYTYRGGRIEIGGLSPSASRLIPLLEASPLFRNVQFSSAIVSQGKESERFKIRLYLEEEGG